MASLGRKNKKKKEERNLLLSFKYGFNGIWCAIKKERHIKLALVIITVGIIIGYYFKLSSTEWLICIIHSSLVMTLEMINTAIEKSIDIAMPNIHPIAKIAKDLSAGAVVLACIFALISAIIILLPKIINML